MCDNDKISAWKNSLFLHEIYTEVHERNEGRSDISSNSIKIKK